jgi:hypothetical protein
MSQSKILHRRHTGVVQETGLIMAGILEAGNPIVRTVFNSILILLFVAACTTTNEIIIDTQGVNMNAYNQDLRACEQYADQVQVGAKVTKGAASGAAIGGATGAVVSRRDWKEDAAVGAIVGGAKGLNEGDRDQVRVVKNCLRGRGYRVLN